MCESQAVLSLFALSLYTLQKFLRRLAHSGSIQVLFTYVFLCLVSQLHDFFNLSECLCSRGGRVVLKWFLMILISRISNSCRIPSSYISCTYWQLLMVRIWQKYETSLLRSGYNWLWLLCRPLWLEAGCYVVSCSGDIHVARNWAPQTTSSQGTGSCQWSPIKLGSRVYDSRTLIQLLSR